MTAQIRKRKASPTAARMRYPVMSKRKKFVNENGVNVTGTWNRHLPA